MGIHLGNFKTLLYKHIQLYYLIVLTIFLTTSIIFSLFCIKKHD